jgi:hypothetical protein
MRFKNLASVKKFVRQKRKSLRLTGRTGAAVAVGTVGVCIVAAAILVAARQPSQVASVANMKSKAPVEAAGIDSTLKAEPRRLGANNAASKAPAPEPAPVTITGCLEHEDGAFRLDKTTGAEAPKSRSWKSGFLKKKSARIDVVDASNKLKLSNQVGNRVSVQGVLVDREMRARSIQRVSGSCGD